MSLRPKKKEPEQVYESKNDIEMLKAIKRQYKLSVLQQKKAMGTLNEFERGQLEAMEAQGE